MATLLRFDGHRVFTYSNDHRPEHVHVTKAERQATFYLNGPDGPVSLRENFGFRSTEIRKIKRRLNEVLPELRAGWDRIHG